MSPAAASRPAYHHGDLQRALLDAARALMAEQQSWDFSLREVARRAGVSHNAPYNHFADKRDLLAALAADGFSRLTACTQAAAAAGDDPEAALLGIGLAYVRFGLDHPALYRLMFGTGFKSYAEALPPQVAAAGAGAKSVLREAIRRGAEAGRFSPVDDRTLEIAVLAAWSGVHGLTMLFLDRLPGEAAAGVPPEAIAAAVLRLQLLGLRRR
jgi:AcrR family transcriptional regulator